MDNTAPPFSIDDNFYKTQLSKDLVFNVYHDGKWGMYFNLPLERVINITTPYAAVNSLSIGDLSNLRWLEERPNIIK